MTVLDDMTPEDLQEAAARFGIKLDHLQAMGIVSRIHGRTMGPVSESVIRRAAGQLGNDAPETVILNGHRYVHVGGCQCYEQHTLPCGCFVDKYQTLMTCDEHSERPVIDTERDGYA